MDAFEGKIAVITGGGSGMGRELAIQLAAAGCSVAVSDLDPAAAEETATIADRGAPHGVRTTSHMCDVADENGVASFRDEVVAAHETNRINLLFNNAGIAGAGSFLTDERAAWERVFDVCWGGVYKCTRVFMPLLVAADSGYIVNTSSINGFWATHGFELPATAYAAAKFAVKGFSEALIEDLRMNAPHVQVAVVMPGAIGTGIISNSRRIRGDRDELECLNAIPASTGFSLDRATSEEIQRYIEIEDEIYKEFAPTSAGEAAEIILAAVREGRWRVLVGEDAKELDEGVRATPELAYEPDFAAVPDLPWLMPMLMVRVLYDSKGDPGLSATFDIQYRDERFKVVVDRGQATARRGEADAPDAVIKADPHTLYAVLAREATREEVEGRGDLVVDGDRTKVDRFFGAV